VDGPAAEYVRQHIQASPKRPMLSRLAKLVGSYANNNLERSIAFKVNMPQLPNDLVGTISPRVIFRVREDGKKQGIR
jgi:hypothetical protein